MKIKSVLFGMICLISFGLKGQPPYSIVSVNPNYITPGQNSTLIFVLDKQLQAGDSIEYAGLWIYYQNTVYYNLFHSDSLSVISDSIVEAVFHIPADNYDSTGIPYLHFSNYYDSIGGMPVKVASVIGAVKPAICEVSVDSANKNVVLWDAPSDPSIDSVWIYRETSVANVYAKVGGKSAPEASIFEDQGSNPLQQANIYKISFADSAGNESKLSDRHKTIHLTLSGATSSTVNLSWDAYWGFVYNTFYIYRGSSKNGMQEIGEVAANLYTFSDLSPAQGENYYQVAVKGPGPCIFGNSDADTTSYSRSNYVQFKVVSSIKSIISEDGLFIYPNPFQNRLTVRIDNPDMKNVEVAVYDLTGRLIYNPEVITGNVTLNLSGLKNGTYLLKIWNNNKIFSRVIVKE